MLAILVQATEGILHWRKIGIAVQSSDLTVPETTDRDSQCQTEIEQAFSGNQIPILNLTAHSEGREESSDFLLVFRRAERTWNTFLLLNKLQSLNFMYMLPKYHVHATKVSCNVVMFK